MAKASSSTIVKAPREQVFAVYADRENYGKLVAPIGGALLQPGTSERQGEGAVHRIGVGSVGLREQIVAIEPGRSFTYSMVSKSPFRRWLGTVEFHDDPQGTRVDYTLDVEARVPVPAAVVTVLVKGLAGPLARGAAKQLRK